MLRTLIKLHFWIFSILMTVGVLGTYDSFNRKEFFTIIGPALLIFGITLLVSFSLYRWAQKNNPIKPSPIPVFVNGILWVIRWGILLWCWLWLGMAGIA